MDPNTCAECGASPDGKRGTRGPRKFCDKSCAQGFRNRGRAVRTTVSPASVAGARWIPLTKGLFALVDEVDFADVSQWNWCAMRVRGTWYAARGRTTDDAGGKTAPVLMHRYLLGEPAEEIDHCDRDGLNNRRENLRKVTHAQNGMNSLSRKGSSRFKGVARTSGRWRASIRSSYKTIHLGGFDTEDEAARAYDEVARRLHGEFARVNFPREGERSALHV
jgi:hypothetical protein